MNNLVIKEYFREEFNQILKDEGVEEVMIWNRGRRYRLPKVVEIKTGYEFLRLVKWFFGEDLTGYVVWEEEYEHEKDEYGEED